MLLLVSCAAALSKIRHNSNSVILKVAYHSVFGSNLLYSTQLWGQINLANQNSIQVLQNHAIRKVCFKKSEFAKLHAICVSVVYMPKVCQLLILCAILPMCHMTWQFFNLVCQRAKKLANFSTLLAKRCANFSTIFQKN